MNNNIQGNNADIEILSIKNNINKNKKQIDIISQKWNTKTNIESKYYLLIKIPSNKFKIEIIGSIPNNLSQILYLKDKIESFTFNNSNSDFKYNYLFECNIEEEYTIKINSQKEIKSMTLSGGSITNISKIQNIHYILKYKYNESDNTIQDLKTDISCNKQSNLSTNIAIDNENSENENSDDENSNNENSDDENSDDENSDDENSNN